MQRVSKNDMTKTEQKKSGRIDMTNVKMSRQVMERIERKDIKRVKMSLILKLRAKCRRIQQKVKNITPRKAWMAKVTSVKISLIFTFAEISIGKEKSVEMRHEVEHEKTQEKLKLTERNVADKTKQKNDHDKRATEK